MKLHLLSDLHLEFSAFEPPATDADVIVLSGDIGKGNKGVYWARQNFPDKPILYVPGNHEFYGARRLETLRLMHIAGQQNDVQILDDSEWVMGQENVRFLGCTLWTDFRLFGDDMKQQAMSAGHRGLNDFRLIQEEEGQRFTPAQSIELHEKSLAWLVAKLDEPLRKDSCDYASSAISSPGRTIQDDLLSACFAGWLSIGKNGFMDTWSPRDYLAMRRMALAYSVIRVDISWARK
jgi:hypothetical protein